VVKKLLSSLLDRDVAQGEAVEIKRRFLLPWLDEGSYAFGL
jgi:hypothetical protein